ncbi:MAG: tRNA-specific 2-thiouridylase, partial [Ignavibacteriaceae bacterium]|nr:tRNA-specific 2-thiouridylase [Ignavibacteriaceae bacterium]
MKIAVLLSGGVDSSIALRLLKDEGHNITAFYLKIWLQDEFSFLGECPWEEDLKYARGVCEQANVPLEVIPLQTAYWDNVVSYTIEEIKEGRTPNPDIFCNSLIKFGEFYDKIDDSFEKVASG